MKVGKVICLLVIVIDYSIGANVFDQLCNRIFFKQPRDKSVLASKEIINGVFIKSNIVVDSFPVYIHERKSVYFQYNRRRKMFFFSHPELGLSYYSGIGALGNSYYMESPNRWVNSTAAKKDNIFGSLIIGWYQSYEQPAKVGSNYYLRKPLIAKCVNFTDCQFGNLAFTQKYGSNISVDLFKPLNNVYNNYRQVYIHNSSKLYLFFSNNFWNVGDNYNSNLVSWFVDDQALKPEFISSYWKRYSGKKWETQYGALVECYGDKKTCSDLKCENNSTCSSNRFNNSLCTCPFSFTGKSCQNTVNETCPKTLFTKVSSLPGAIDSQFCSTSKFYNKICKRGSNNKLAWHSNDKCKSSTSRRRTTPIYYRRRSIRIPPLPNRRRSSVLRRRYSWRRRNTKEIFDSTWVIVVVVVASCTLPFLGPGLLSFLCKLGRYGRVNSLWCYISMWIYVIYLIILHKYNLYQYGTVLFRIMDWVAIGSMIYFYLTVLILSLYFEEMEYVSGNLEGEDSDVYLNQLMAEAPILTVDVSCYHYETRTRIVTYTDANGNTQTRMETYQEMVVTHRDSKKFPFKSWRDVSDRKTMPVLKNKSMRIKLDKDIIFENEETKNEFLKFKNDFRERNEHKDVYIDVGVESHIDGFQERFMASKRKSPCWISRCNFFWAHVIGLGWPYIWLVNNSTDKANFSMLKEISIFENLFSSSNGHATAPFIDRTSNLNQTMTAMYYDTASETLQSREPTNNVIPPAYPPYRNSPPPPYTEYAQYPGANNNGYTPS